MTSLQICGVLWIAIAAFALAMTLVFRVDMTQTVVTGSLSAVAAAVGAWLLLRPTAAAIRATAVVGAVWAVVYAALTIIQSDDPAAWVTDAGLAVGGGALTLLTWSAREAAATGSPPKERTSAP